MHQARRLGFHLFKPNEESLLELCFSSALLLETCGAALHLPLLSPTLGERWRGELWQRQIKYTISVTLSLSLVLLHLPLFSLANIKHVVWKGKSLLLRWRRPHGAARLPDLTDKVLLFRQKVWHIHTHTQEWNLFHGLQGHLAIAQEKVRSG